MFVLLQTRSQIRESLFPSSAMAALRFLCCLLRWELFYPHPHTHIFQDDKKKKGINNRVENNVLSNRTATTELFTNAFFLQTS